MFYAIAVGPYDRIKPMLWVDMLRTFDVKRWTIAKETGKGGYMHWQIRIACSGKYEDWFTWMQKNSEGLLHMEESQSWSDYERKEGHYYTSEDTARIRKQRFGKLRWYQKAVLNVVRATNDREVVVWYDGIGNQGKSWLCSHLYETGQANILNPMGEARKLVQDVCSMYVNGGPDILVINIPRTWKWTKDLLVAIETIKDGLLSDPRYSNTTINRDLKLLICTNEKPHFDSLSADRWVLMEKDDGLMLEERFISGPKGKAYHSTVTVHDDTWDYRPVDGREWWGEGERRES